MVWQNKLSSWSYSRWSTYMQCPFKARLQFINKLPTFPHEAMERGSELHKEIDRYLKGEDEVLDNNIVFFRDVIDSLKSRAAESEASWCFRKSWMPTTWDDWDGCWLRVKVDAFIKDDDSILIIDWKTGKHSEARAQEYKQQLELYVLAALKFFPEIENVEADLCWVDNGATEKLTYKRSDGAEATLQKNWEDRTAAMLADSAFSPKPSALCRWCDYSKTNGGPCRF
jgi:RecB family exonuclease